MPEEDQKSNGGVNLARLLLYYIIIGFLGWIFFSFIFTSPFFGIERVTIHGNNYLCNEDILIQAGIEFQTNLFHFNLKEASQRLLGNPWVDSVLIRKKFPNQLSIEIAERQPKVLLVWDNQFYLVNKEGIILLVSDQLSNQFGLTILTGLDIGTKKSGDVIDCQEYIKVQKIIVALEDIFPDQFYKIQIVSIDEYLLFHKEHPIKVRIESSDQLVNEWYLLESAMQKVIQEKIPLKEINMKFKDRLSIILEE